MKTLLKIHSNGDFECVDADLIESKVEGEYSFRESDITVPRIIEYPPDGIVNHFVEKDSEEGWSLGGGISPPNGNNDRTSGYINVSDWETCTVVLSQSDAVLKKPNFRILFYHQLNFNGRVIYSDQINKTETGNSVSFKCQFNVQNENYIRISMDHYDNPDIEIKLGVYEGLVDFDRHYLSLGDMPHWVKNTNSPVSIFKEGIVIKGKLIRGR